MATEPADDATAREHGPGVGNAETFDERLEELTRAARASAVRALLVVESEAAPPERSRPTDRADRLAARLGSENRSIVHDARRSLDPALLAAEAGTVPAGGIVALLVPPLVPRDPAPPRSRSTARFARLLLEHLTAEPGTSARVALSTTAVAALADDAMAPVRTRPERAGPDAGAPAPTATALTAQDALLERALEYLGNVGRPLIVVEAPRGHGKSALLGRLAARLAESGRAPTLCAARRPAVDVLLRHHRATAGPDAAAPRFVAPDAALAAGGDTLIVDEAASLPLPLLERLASRWRRLVLATTSAGYESAGRAFALRLPGILDRERPGWLRLTPLEPMRWRAGDPLDALLNRAILADAELAPLTAPSDPERTTLSRVDRDALADDETRLKRLFGLLVATHYQSTPLDLGHLLDGEGMALWSIERGSDVLGAALVAIEPGVPDALHEDVLARRRRLPHRLLPQLLAQSANDGSALGATFARVVRIAVHPAARRRGLGHRLLSEIVRDTQGAVEAAGASFGETPATAAFWRTSGFTAFHRGHRLNPRSGRRALAVLRAGSPRTRRALDVAAAIHRDNAASGLAPPPRVRRPT